MLGGTSLAFWTAEIAHFSTYITAEEVRVSILRMISYLPSCRSEYCVANVDCRRNYSIELVHISAGAKKSNVGVDSRQGNEFLLALT
jgi:hypothetical protein